MTAVSVNKRQTILKKYSFIIIALIIMLLVMYLPLPDSILTVDGATLTLQGRISLGVLAFCLTLWISEAIPFHITGFLGMILLTLFKAATFSETVKLSFGNDIICFFIGVLTLSAFITKSGL